MKRLYVSAALLPLLYAAGANAETKITTAVTAPVATATATANGQPDDLTIDTAGSVKPTTAGAAVTLNSNNAVKNAGAIAFNNLDNSTGILVQAGRTGSVTNTGSINVVEDYTPEDADKDGDADGAMAKGTGRFGIRVVGAGDFTGSIRNDVGGTINVEGNNSAGIQVDARLVGNLVNAGAVTVIGDNSAGVKAAGVTGDVRILGSVTVRGGASTGVSLTDVAGTVQLQNTISASGYRYTDRPSADDTRAKLDADDLLQGGPAVLITGNVGKGVLLDKPPADASTTDNDEDKDGITDSAEGTATITSYGAAAGLQIGGLTASTIGAVGAGADAYGLVIRGQVGGNGVYDGVSATGVRIGQTGTTALTTVTGGINIQGGTIAALAYGGDATTGGATALKLEANANVPAVRNSGTIQAGATAGAQNATAILDLSGRLALIENTGAISAATTPKTGTTAVGQAVAIDLAANTTGAVVRQSKSTVASAAAPAIVGDVRFGSGADRLELLGGGLAGAISFGAGADTFVIDGAAVASGQVSDSDGALTLDVRDGRLALANKTTLQATALSLGAKGVLALNVDPNAAASAVLKLSGAATFAAGSQVEVNLTSLLKTAKTFDLVQAGSLTSSGTGVSLAGAPYMYQGALRSTANSLVLDLRPKTAAELGLNRSGAEAYDAVFAALGSNTAVQNAFLAQKTQAGFSDLYDQMLPDHSGGALMSAQAISSAISLAVGSPLARQTNGSNGIWAQEILFDIDRDAKDAQGYKSRGFGLAAGAEMLGEYNALGINGSFVSTDYRDQGAAADEKITMNFAEAGMYWRLQAGGLSADARAGLGYVHFDSDRKLATDTLNLANSGKWNGWLVDLHAGAAYEARMGAFYARPELSAAYLRLSEGSYDEKGGGAGFDLSVAKRKGDLLTGEAVLALGAQWGQDGSTFGPELKVGWRAKLAGDPGKTTAHFAGGSNFSLDPEDVAAGGAIIRVGLKGESTQVVYGVDAGGVFDSGYRQYDVRAVVRFLF